MHVTNDIFFLSLEKISEDIHPAGIKYFFSQNFQ